MCPLTFESSSRLKSSKSPPPPLALLVLAGSSFSSLSGGRGEGSLSAFRPPNRSLSSSRRLSIHGFFFLGAALAGALKMSSSEREGEERGKGGKGERA